MAEEKMSVLNKEELGTISGGVGVYDVTDGHQFHIQTNSLNDDIEFANEYKRVTKHSVLLINDDLAYTEKEIADANIKINGLPAASPVQKTYEKLQGDHKGRKGGKLRKKECFDVDYYVEKVGPEA